MKTVKLTLLSMLFLAAFAGCSKSNDSNNNANTNFMTAKVDGASYVANLVTQATITSGSPRVCSFAGTGTNGQINIALGNYAGPGTYTIGSSDPANSAIYTLTASPFTAYTANFILGSGTVTITSDTGGMVQGTFSFSAQNNSGGTTVTKNITEGSFKISL